MRRMRPALAAAFVAAVLLACGCSHVASDQQIATAIQARMFSDPELRGSALKIGVKQGVATVAGQVDSVSARYEAFKVASETPGVKSVDDEMTVEEAANHTEASAAPALRSEPAPKTRHEMRRQRAVAENSPSADETADSQPAAQAAPETAPQEQTASSPAPAAPEASAAPAQAAQPPTPPETITIPAGTPVSVQMIDAVSSRANHTGDILHASLATPITANDQTVAPAGADVYLRLVQVHSAGHYSGRSELRLELDRIVIQGTSYPVISNDYVDQGASRTKRSLLTVLGGSAVGAAIGAIAGGGKGAAIGAATGGAGGVVYQGVTKSGEVNIPPETELKFKLAQPLAVTVNPGSSPSNPQQAGSPDSPQP